MVEVRWTLQAAEDLAAIAEFIGRDSSHYAQRFVINLITAVESLESFPTRGRIVPELQRPNTREILFGSYRIIYRFHGSLVELLTLYHGARLIDPKRFD